MKKQSTLALVLVLVMCCALIVSGCGSKGGDAGSADAGKADSGVMGKWVLTGAKAAGIEVTSDQLSAFGEISFEFKADGAVTYNMAGQSFEGAYTEENGTINIDDAGAALNLKVEGETLTLDQEGVTLIFTR